ncbi:EVE domain-containing protein [Deinococcus rubellus]|uniref:EVE domain-containing protein n=1 Tax=Deinococcus rubellus TaxID=1889240 RepID=A0ABY5YDE6_9DEIO|nr:EVE domain-containing protein [Deinococcus rubellus]UWX62860.1 EVE domain-containing protein [Deinococcus rubellus]
MKFWLLKSEPDVFGYADLMAAGTEAWNGVRNYQARNFLRQMQVGELCLFYHSSTRPAGVAGVARVVRAAYPDDLQFDGSSPYFDARSKPDSPSWSMVDVAAVAALPHFQTLDALRTKPELSGLRLLQKGNRLSVLPVSAEEFRIIVEAGGLSLDRLLVGPGEVLSS